MNAVDLIERKKRGLELTPGEISGLVAAYAAGELPDCQMAAWLMAVRWQGLSPRELRALVEAYLAGSARVSFGSDGPPVVDKHSTGGVGDKTSLIVAPVAAACGLRVAKISGRGLGITGGTIDKLEAIPGFSADLSVDAFARQVDQIGLAIAAHSSALVPADRKIYGLRDVTATIDSIPLIAASIVSKKLALDTQAVVFDVKVGRGAFMAAADQAQELASTMLALIAHAGRRGRALLTQMNEPLGAAVGHSLEVGEALETLRGRGDRALRELATALVSALLELTGVDPVQPPDAALDNGTAYERFAALVCAQGGDLYAFEREPPHQRVAVRREIRVSATGFVRAVDAAAIGHAAHGLGGGRRVKGGDIDRGVGVVLAAKTGSEVAPDTLLAEVYARDAEAAERACVQVASAFEIGAERCSPRPVILEQLESPG